MELIKAGGTRLVFQISKRERILLSEILKLYPLLSTSFQKVSRAESTPEAAEAQRLLEEALAEQKRENKKKLQTLLRDSNRFQPAGDEFRFVLDRSEMEWLLQVLNDVRIGSWIILGSPDPQSETRIQIEQETARYFLAMEMAGYFESALLRAGWHGE